jgi:hypothetical protein
MSLKTLAGVIKVAISDAIGQVIWMRNFLEAQGYKLPP